MSKTPLMFGLSFAVAVACLGIEQPVQAQTVAGGEQKRQLQPKPEVFLIGEFDADPLDERFHVNFGRWTNSKGMLVGSEVASDKHAAAARWRVPLEDGKVRFKLMLAGAKAFHVGFDPAPGELKKKGHLYSLVVTPKGASILKHRDKADKDSKNETLATANSALPKDQWVDVELVTRGTHVSATVGDNLKLEASDATFGVKKPGIVFRVVGQSVFLDDVEVEHIDE